MRLSWSVLQLVLWLQSDGGWCWCIQEGWAQLDTSTAGLSLPCCFHLSQGLSLAQWPSTQGHMGLLKATAQNPAWPYFRHTVLARARPWSVWVQWGRDHTWAAYQAASFLQGRLWRGTVAPEGEGQATEMIYLKYLAGCPVYTKYSTNNRPQKRDTFQLENNMNTGTEAGNTVEGRESTKYW